MTDKEVKEKNRIIAEYMGATVKETDNYFVSYGWGKELNRGVAQTPKTWYNTSKETEEYVYNNLLDPSYGRWGRFHLKWSWLMLVIEKIENTTLSNLKGFDSENLFDFSVTIFEDVCTIESASLSKKDGFEIQVCEKTKIEATFKAVVKFIEWYNNLKL